MKIAIVFSRRPASARNVSTRPTFSSMLAIVPKKRATFGFWSAYGSRYLGGTSSGAWAAAGAT